MPCQRRKENGVKNRKWGGGGIEGKREDGCEMASQEGQGLQGSCKVETKDIYTSHVKRLWKWVEACKANKWGNSRVKMEFPEKAQLRGWSQAWGLNLHFWGSRCKT